MKKIVILIIISCLTIPLKNSYAEIYIDLQGGPVLTGYNDVRIPGDSGTMVSLSDELNSETAWTFRAEAGYLYKKNYLGFLFTPLRVESTGTLNRDINFNNTVFNSGENLKALFRFDSYRMTYRYAIYSGDIFSFKAGFTAKIRDASIRFESGNKSSESTNTGFVPIINFAVKADLPANIFLYLGGDALAAPQGRAEDIAFFAGYAINDNFKIKAGYRLLEGGADNDEVYTFSMFHYALVGIEAEF